MKARRLHASADIELQSTKRKHNRDKDQPNYGKRSRAKNVNKERTAVQTGNRGGRRRSHRQGRIDGQKWKIENEAETPIQISHVNECTLTNRRTQRTLQIHTFALQIPRARHKIHAQVNEKRTLL